MMLKFDRGKGFKIDRGEVFNKDYGGEGLTFDDGRGLRGFRLIVGKDWSLVMVRV